MKRRELLKLGALAGATGLTGLGGSSCLLPRVLFDNDPLALPDMDTYLALIDRGVDHIENWSPPADHAGDRQGNQSAERLGRKALKTLFLTAMFSDLPAEGQMHPGMQERMWRAMPDMDEAVFGMTERVRSRTPDQWNTLQATLRAPTGPGMLAAERIDRHAAGCGLTVRRRLQTRAMFAYVDGRLRKQPPGLLVDEYLAKIDKLRERGGSTGKYRQKLISRMGDEGFLQYQCRLAAAMQQWRARAATPPGAKSADGGTEPDGGTAAGHPYPPAAEPEEAGGDSGLSTMGVGGIIMGIGALTLTAGGIVLSEVSGLDGAFVMTAGGVIMLIGLIVLIVGVVID